MTVVSSKEFVSNEDKYFDMALNEHIFIRRGNNMFIVTTVNDDDDEDDDADLALAIERRSNSEFTSSDEFKKYLRR